MVTRDRHFHPLSILQINIFISFFSSWVWETLTIAVAYLDRRCKAEAITCASRRDFLEKLEQRQRSGKRRTPPSMDDNNDRTEEDNRKVRNVKEEAHGEASQESSRMPTAKNGNDNGGGGNGESAEEMGEVMDMDGRGGTTTAAAGGADDSFGMGLQERVGKFMYCNKWGRKFGTKKIYNWI